MRSIYTHNASVMYVLLNVRPAYEFRRGFCTCSDTGATVLLYPAAPAAAQELTSIVSCRLSLDWILFPFRNEIFHPAGPYT